MDLMITDNDIVTDGDLMTVSGPDAIAQRVAIRLKVFFGEWFDDRALGTPWTEIVFQKGVSPELVSSIINEQILATPGITSVVNSNYELNTVTRNLEITFRATGDDGFIFDSELEIVI